MKVSREDGIPEDPAKPNPAWKIAMVGGPLFLIVSTGWVLWIWWKESQDDSIDSRLALSSASAEVEELDDTVYKLGKVLGARGWDSSAGHTNMRRAIALIDGTLSPRNYGYKIRRGGHLDFADHPWPTLWADLKGASDPERIVLVNAAYDRSDAAVALVLAVARDLRDEEFAPTIRFIFHPAMLYRNETPEKTLADVLARGEVMGSMLVPEVAQEGKENASRGGWNGARLKPLADAFAQQVRESAREGS